MLVVQQNLKGSNTKLPELSSQVPYPANLFVKLYASFHQFDLQEEIIQMTEYLVKAIWI